MVYQISDQLVYWPNFPPDSRVLVQQPSSIGLPSENLYIYARDGTKLHAVFIKQDEATVQLAPTFIYFHGNAGNMGHRYGMYYVIFQHALFINYIDKDLICYCKIILNILLLISLIILLKY